MGYDSAAVCHGRARFRHRRHCAHATDILGGDMRGAEPHGSCRRRGSRRLLCEHGRLCGRFVQGKRLGRRSFSGAWHLDAANGQHRAQPEDMDTCHRGKRRYRPCRHLPVQA